MSKKGYQVVDIGHLDLEYEWYLAGQGKRTTIPYKYNNEVEGDDNAIEIHDERYESQILETFM